MSNYKSNSNTYEDYLAHVYGADNVNEIADIRKTSNEILSRFRNYSLQLASILFLSIIEGFSNSFVSKAFSQTLEYTLINIKELDDKILAGKISTILGYFTGTLLISKIRENIIDSISDDMGEKFYQEKIKVQAYDKKALIKMQTENIPIVNVLDLKAKYRKIIKTLLENSSRITTSTAYTMSFFTSTAVYSAVTGITLSINIYTGLSYAAVGFAFEMVVMGAEFILNGYYAKQTKNLQKAQDRLEKFQMEINNDSKKLAQNKVENIKDKSEIRLKKSIDEETAKLKNIKFTLDMLSKALVILSFASKIGPDIFALASNHITVVQMLAKYLTRLGFEITTNNSKSKENFSQFNADLVNISKSMSKLNEYADKKINIKYQDEINSISFKNFDLKVGNDQNLRILIKNINKSFATGLVHVIEGKTGSGKSTLIDSIDGLHHLFDGEIILPKSFENNSKAIQYVSQKGMQNISSATLFEILTDGIDISEDKEKIVIDEINDLLHSLHLGKFKDKLGSNLTEPSGGEQRRLLIIKAILSRAEVIIIDEGLGALSDNIRKDTEKLLKAYVSGEYKYNRGIKSMILSIEHPSGNEEDRSVAFVDRRWNIYNQSLIQKVSRTESTPQLHAR